MTPLDLEFWTRAVDRLAAAFQRNEARLCSLDGAIGDGDHGTSMLLGFHEAQKGLRARPAADIGDLFKRAGEAFLENVGGVTGIVFGSLFDAVGRSAGEMPSALDAGCLHRAFAAGLTAVKKRGGAAEGDKSMLDALSPAVEALRSAAEDGETAHAALARAARAAAAGVQATIDMEGRVGRARSQPGKCRGHADAGAASLCLFFETLAGMG